MLFNKKLFTNQNSLEESKKIITILIVNFEIDKLKEIEKYVSGDTFKNQVNLINLLRVLDILQSSFVIIMT